ncbi:MAG: response regulator, partial [Myxococcaceae bacterium]
MPEPVDILVVDDTPNNLESMKALLADSGARIVVADSGTAALRALLERDFAVILLDVQMPDIDGYATAQLVRARDRSRQTPIIFLTAYGRTEAQVLEGYSLGAVDYLFKPIIPEILKSKVAFFIDLHRKRDQAQKQAELLREAEKREHARALAEAQQRYERRLLEEAAERDRKLAEALSARAEELIRLVAEKEEVERALRRTNERLQTIGTVASQLLVTPDPAARIQELYGRLGAHLGLEMYLAYLFDEAGDVLHLRSWMGIRDTVAEELREQRAGIGWIGTVAETGMRGVMDPEMPDPAARTLAEKLGAGTLVCVSLLTPQRVLGVLVVGSRKRRALLEDDLAVVQIGCDQLAVAIERTALIDRLRETDRRKDEFLAMLGHELRNPLVPIRNSLEVCRERAGSDEVLQRTLVAADRQIRHVTRLLDDLLDVSRITRGKVELRRQRVELSTMVEQAVHLTEPLIRQRRHTLKLEVPDLPVVLDADPARLAQIIANLLQNAAKYTEPGGHIALRAAVAGDRLHVRVEDTGIGIRREMLGRIFEMFVQEEPKADRALGGLGLGLTLVKQLTEMHGGRIEAFSDGLGCGSTFEVVLPMADLAPPPAIHPRPRAAPAAVAPPLRVLLVEDNVDVRATMRDLLELRGHEVHE